MVLPLEIIGLILEEAKEVDPKGLHNMRLVSRSINELVEPALFASVDLVFSRWTATTMADLLEYIASGSGPYPRWTKRVKICPNARFIRCLDNSLTGEILESLGSIPKLHRLYLEDVNFPGSETADAQRLLSRSLGELAFHSRSVSGWVAVRTILASSPAMASLDLEVGTAEAESRIDLVQLFDPSKFSPSIQRLTLARTGVRLSSNSVFPLKSLTYLQLRKKNIADPSFWAALEAEQIHLRCVYLHSPDSPSLRYLISYSGLEKLQLKTWHETDANPAADDDLTSMVLHSVLPKHKGTLRLFQFGYARLGPWSVKESLLKAMSNYGCLRELDVLYEFRFHTEARKVPCIPLGDVITSIGRAIPSLQLLRVHCYYEYPPLIWGEADGPELYRKLVEQSVAFTVIGSDLHIPHASLPDRLVIPGWTGFREGSFKPVPGSSPGHSHYQLLGAPWGLPVDYEELRSAVDRGAEMVAKYI